jgi:nicotinamidase-related amidase
VSIALVIVDMQRGMQGTDPQLRNNSDAEKNIAALLNTWRESARPVVHVRHISRDPKSPFWPGQAGAEFQPAFQPLTSEHVVEKNVPDAFVNTGLERWLHARVIKSVAIVGVSTNISIESTARTSGDLGFKTYVVSDATFAFAKTDYSGVHRSAADVHAMSLANLDGEFATIVLSAALIANQT